MPPARFVASGGPTNLDLRIAAVCPTQLLQGLPERRNAGLAFGIVCGYGHKNADPPHAITLLRARHPRPRRSRAAEQRDELAPLQFIELHPLAQPTPGQHIALVRTKSAPRCSAIFRPG